MSLSRAVSISVYDYRRALAMWSWPTATTCGRALRIQVSRSEDERRNAMRRTARRSSPDRWLISLSTSKLASMSLTASSAKGAMTGSVPRAGRRYRRARRTCGAACALCGAPHKAHYLEYQFYVECPVARADLPRQIAGCRSA